MRTLLKYEQFILVNEKKDKEDNEKYHYNILLKIKNDLEKSFKDDNKKTINSSDFDLKLEEIKMGNGSPITDSLEIKFTDERAYYTLIIKAKRMDLAKEKDGEPKDEDKEKESEQVQADVSLKKYTLDNLDLVGEIEDKTDLERFDIKTLIDFKLKIDEEFDNDDKNVEIKW